MPLETAPFINSLVSTNPANADPVQQGADHLRLLKAAIKSSFPNVTGAVSATHTELNGAPARLTALETNRARKDIAETFADVVISNVRFNAPSITRDSREVDPIGTVKMYLVDGAPAGYIPLKGGAYSRTTYAALFAIIGTTYGAGDGSTTFNVPDARLRFPLGAGSGDLNGTTGGSKTPTIVVTAAGGHSHTGETASFALTTTYMPSHSHGVNDPSHGHTVTDPGHTHGSSGMGNLLKLGADSALGYAYPTPNGTYIGWGTPANSDAATTGISIQGAVTGISIQSTGSGAAHAHNIAAEANHAHAATIADGRPPYFTVTFIVRAL